MLTPSFSILFFYTLFSIPFCNLRHKSWRQYVHNHTHTHIYIWMYLGAHNFMHALRRNFWQSTIVLCQLFLNIAWRIQRSPEKVVGKLNMNSFSLVYMHTSQTLTHHFMWVFLLHSHHLGIQLVCYTAIQYIVA